MAMTERFPYAIYFIYDESANFVSVRRLILLKMPHLI